MSTEEKIKPDIAVYENTPEKYSEYQNCRPDYSRAIERTIDVAIAMLGQGSKENSNLRIADFCGGAGGTTREFIKKIGSIERATVIDINPHFIEQINQARDNINGICADILSVDQSQIGENDLIFSTFAWHHMKHDIPKELFLKQISDHLSENGIAVVTEIYLPSGRDTEYYKALYDKISSDKKDPRLWNFLLQTAQSSNFEFKVAKQKFDDYLKKIPGLIMIYEEKIWPLQEDQVTSPLFLDPHVGTFVQVLKKSTMPLMGKI